MASLKHSTVNVAGKKPYLNLGLLIIIKLMITEGQVKLCKVLLFPAGLGNGLGYGSVQRARASRRGQKYLLLILNNDKTKQGSLQATFYREVHLILKSSFPHIFFVRQQVTRMDKKKYSKCHIVRHKYIDSNSKNEHFVDIVKEEM